MQLLERADQREADQAEGLRRAWAEGVASLDAGSLDFAELREAAWHQLAISRIE